MKPFSIGNVRIDRVTMGFIVDETGTLQQMVVRISGQGDGKRLLTGDMDGVTSW